MTSDSVSHTHSPPQAAGYDAEGTPIAAVPTPGPWAVHPVFKTYVVPACDVEKQIGGAADPDREASNYAKEIVSTQGTEYRQFWRSRVLPEEAKANARLIAAAPELISALRELVRAWDSTRPGTDRMQAALDDADRVLMKVDYPQLAGTVPDARQSER